ISPNIRTFPRALFPDFHAFAAQHNSRKISSCQGKVPASNMESFPLLRNTVGIDAPIRSKSMPK
ncbi:MAG: hypothetical protein KH050_11550, partial [Clostridiaceae bacterium]|nr:hypothetical protein [Clostridiaceae bacterium]